MEPTDRFTFFGSMARSTAPYLHASLARVASSVPMILGLMTKRWGKAISWGR